MSPNCDKRSVGEMFGLPDLGCDRGKDSPIGTEVPSLRREFKNKPSRWRAVAHNLPTILTSQIDRKCSILQRVFP